MVIAKLAPVDRFAAYPPGMRPSGWLFLAGAALAVLGLLAFWPALLIVPFVSYGAWKQRETEEKAAVRARYAHTRRH